MQIGSQKLRDEVARACQRYQKCDGALTVHVLEGRDEDIAQTDNLQDVSSHPVLTLEISHSHVEDVSRV
jgi:hypothetical protein